MNSLLETAALLAEILERMKAPYLIGGSVASSLYGIPRATQGIDFVVALQFEQVPKLIAELEKDFYVDAYAVREAVMTDGSFNLVRWTTIDKVDVFVRQPKGWVQKEFERRRPLTLSLEGRLVTLYFASPEDTLVHKLLWFQRGGDVLTQQWADVLGILQVRGPDLDFEYLTQQAHAEGVAAFLQEALQQVQCFLRGES